MMVGRGRAFVGKGIRTKDLLFVRARDGSESSTPRGAISAGAARRALRHPRFRTRQRALRSTLSTFRRCLTLLPTKAVALPRFPTSQAATATPASADR